MRRLFFALLAIAGSASLVGCVLEAPVVPPIAVLYSNIRAPIDVNLDGTPVESKRGEASTTTIFGLVSFGDAGIKAAADEGGLTTIESMDYAYLNILGIYQKFTTIVYGK